MQLSAMDRSNHPHEFISISISNVALGVVG